MRSTPFKPPHTLNLQTNHNFPTTTTTWTVNENLVMFLLTKDWEHMDESVYWYFFLNMKQQYPASISQGQDSQKRKRSYCVLITSLLMTIFLDVMLINIITRWFIFTWTHVSSVRVYAKCVQLLSVAWKDFGFPEARVVSNSKLPDGAWIFWTENTL